MARRLPVPVPALSGRTSSPSDIQTQWPFFLHSIVHSAIVAVFAVFCRQRDLNTAKRSLSTDMSTGCDVVFSRHVSDVTACSNQTGSEFFHTAHLNTKSVQRPR